MACQLDTFCEEGVRDGGGSSLDVVVPVAEGEVVDLLLAEAQVWECLGEGLEEVEKVRGGSYADEEEGWVWAVAAVDNCLWGCWLLLLLVRSGRREGLEVGMPGVDVVEDCGDGGGVGWWGGCVKESDHGCVGWVAGCFVSCEGCKSGGGEVVGELGVQGGVEGGF